jgi:hypothetical protein
MDSSDYCTCEVCEAFEVCEVSDSTGPSSGLYLCFDHGHTFCKECFPEFDKRIRTVENVRRIIKENHECSEMYNDEIGRDIETDSDEKVMECSVEILHEFYAEQSVSSKECPLCQEGFVSDDDIFEYLLKKIKMTKYEVAKEMQELK